MRREVLFLGAMIEACDLVTSFIQGMDAGTFMASELHKAATLQKLAVIGEAAARLPQEFRDQHGDVEWRDIIGFRNIAVHAYFSVQWDIVWATACDDVPNLRAQRSWIQSSQRISSNRIFESNFAYCPQPASTKISERIAGRQDIHGQ